MKQNEIAHIEYTRTTSSGGGTKGEVTERHIIPTFVPNDTIRAIDVTGLTESERQTVQQTLKQYQEYYKAAAAVIFSFDDWLEHTGQTLTEDQKKWRTFKTGSIKPLD